MYFKKLWIGYLLWSMSCMMLSAYALSKEDAYHVPIMVDDIITMIPLYPSEVISPANGTKLINGILPMKFSKGSGVEKRYLKVYYSNRTKVGIKKWLTKDSYTISLPKDGKYVDVELYSYIADKYFVKKYRFKQSIGLSYILSPQKDSLLDSAVMTLKWKIGLNVTAQYLRVGTSKYRNTDIYGGFVDGKRSKTLYDLPRNGETIYVQLLSKINGIWYYQYAKYKATDVVERAKYFVKAYLANSTTRMRKIAPKRVIDKLKTKNALVKSYFRKIRTYQKLLYFHNYKAMVIGKTSDNKEIKFYFAWDGRQWILESVI